MILTTDINYFLEHIFFFVEQIRWKREKSFERRKLCAAGLIILLLQRLKELMD